MNIIDTLVTDREQGATYGVQDLNRVAKAILFVAQRLRDCGYTINVSPKTDWKRNDIPRLSDMQNYVGCIETLRRTLTPETAVAPEVPDISDAKDWLTVSEANDLEKILQEIESMIARITSAFFYSGELFSGEV